MTKLPTPAQMLINARSEIDTAYEALGDAAAIKGWLMEHVDHHVSSPVDSCTFCVEVTP